MDAWMDGGGSRDCPHALCAPSDDKTSNVAAKPLSRVGMRETALGYVVSRRYGAKTCHRCARARCLLGCNIH